MRYFFLLKGVSERTFALLLLYSYKASSYKELPFVGLVLLYYHLFEHVITFNFGSFIDLSCVSDLDIFSSYFIHCLDCCIGQANENDLSL